MTTTTLQRAEPKVCAQMISGIAALAILIHFVHEVVALWGEVPMAQPAVGLVLLAVTFGVGAAWYRMTPAVRRTLNVLLGLLWSIAAFEHVSNVASGGSAIDFTGLLTFAGGLALVFASYWDHIRPMEVGQ